MPRTIAQSAKSNPFSIKTFNKKKHINNFKICSKMVEHEFLETFLIPVKYPLIADEMEIKGKLIHII